MPEGEEPKRPEGEIPIWKGIQIGPKYQEWFKDVRRPWMEATLKCDEYDRAMKVHIVAGAVASLRDEVASTEDGEVSPEKTLVIVMGVEYLEKNGNPGLLGSLFG